MLEEMQSLSKVFFEKLWIEIDSLEVISEGEDIFLIKVESKESPLLIWQNGKNLETILSIIKLIFKKRLWEWLKIHIEVNDYLKTKDDKLKNYIISKINIVEKSKKDLKLPFFSAYDRKKIHSIVSEYWNPKIYTKSLWDWHDRRLFICFLNEKITIDLDGSDI